MYLSGTFVDKLIVRYQPIRDYICYTIFCTNEIKTSVER